jgi:hypothetical protein
MKKTTILIAGAIFIFMMAWPAMARNDKYLLPISVALKSKDAQETPNGSVKFFFGKQETAEIVTRLGSYSTHQRSTTRPAEDAIACNVAFLKALVLQKRAQQAGANAVVNIVSYYKNDTLTSETESNVMPGFRRTFMLKGELVKIAER